MTKELSDLHCKIPKTIKQEMERAKTERINITDMVLEGWELRKKKYKNK